MKLSVIEEQLKERLNEVEASRMMQNIKLIMDR